MMMTLLASCDPCGTIEAGGSPLDYMSLASKIADRIGVQGCHPADIVMEFPGHADAASALQFASAALDWWSRDRDRISRAPYFAP